MSQGAPKDVAGVIGAAGKLVGRTKLQKTFCLLELAGQGCGFRFDYYKFGPYSEDLSLVVEKAVDLGYVTEEVTRAQWGGRYSTFKSSFNSALSPIAEKLIALATREDAVVLELAVTAAFLAKEGCQDPWAEVAERKPEKALAENLQKAQAFCSQLRDIEPLAALRIC